MTATCVLCGGSLSHFYQDNRRSYSVCDCCELVQVPSCEHLSAEDEKAIYDLHENSPDDSGYRRFLSRAFKPVTEHLDAGAKGLDFGCGPGPVLSEMFDEVGYPCSNYDLYYFPDRSVLEARYDFITATEVIEHLSQPRKVLGQLWGILESGGVLAIMTKRWLSKDAFASWHYKNDMTHIIFFNEATFIWVAQWLDAELIVEGADVVLLKKP